MTEELIDKSWVNDTRLQRPIDDPENDADAVLEIEPVDDTGLQSKDLLKEETHVVAANQSSEVVKEIQEKSQENNPESSEVVKEKQEKSQENNSEVVKEKQEKSQEKNPCNASINKRRKELGSDEEGKRVHKRRKVAQEREEDRMENSQRHHEEQDQEAILQAMLANPNVGLNGMCTLISKTVLFGKEKRKLRMGSVKSKWYLLKEVMQRAVDEKGIYNYSEETVRSLMNRFNMISK